MLSATHQFEAVYNASTCDYASGLNVRVSVAAGCATEHVAPAPAALPALVAGLASIAGVDVFNFNTGALRLVGHEGLQLAETPTAHHAIEVAAPDTRALTDAGQPFEPDYSVTLPFGFVNDALAQDVVLVADAPGFVARQTLETAPRPRRALGLQAGADTVPLPFECLPLGTFVQRAMTGRGGVADTKVNAHRRPLDRRNRLVFDYDVNAPVAAITHEYRRAGLAPAQGITLVSTQRQGDVPAPGDRGQRDRFVALAVIEDAGVIIDASRPKQQGSTAVPLSPGQGRCRASDSAGGEIGRQAEIPAQVVVAQLVQLDVIGFTVLERGVASGGKGDAGIRQRLGGGGVGQELATDSPPHSETFITTPKERAIPLPPEGGSLLARNL